MKYTRGIAQRFFCIVSLSVVMAYLPLFAVSEKSRETKSCVVFAHGLGGTGKGHSRAYVKAGMFPNCRVTYVEFPDSPRVRGNRGKLNTCKTCFGQGEEKELLEMKIKKEQERSDKILLFGVSRGAIAVLNADFTQVSGVFVESPASTLEDVAFDQCNQYGFGWIPNIGKLMHEWVFPWLFERYNPKGITPIAKVPKVPHTVPVFIAYTKQDALIPASSSVKLAYELVKSGHKQVYLYGSEAGKHGSMFTSEYAHVAHAFLKQCGALAKEYDCKNGDELLALCKMQSVEQVESISQELRYAEWRSYFCRNLAVFSIVATCSTLLVKKLVSALINYAL